MPRSNGRPINRRRKTAKPDTTHCVCGAKATKVGLCVQCLSKARDPLAAAVFGTVRR